MPASSTRPHRPLRLAPSPKARCSRSTSRSPRGGVTIEGDVARSGRRRPTSRTRARTSPSSVARVSSSTACRTCVVTTVSVPNAQRSAFARAGTPSTSSSCVAALNEATGPSLYALGRFLAQRGCENALNLDGGPSTGVAYREGDEVKLVPPRAGVRQVLVFRNGVDQRWSVPRLRLSAVASPERANVTRSRRDRPRHHDVQRGRARRTERIGKHVVRRCERFEEKHGGRRRGGTRHVLRCATASANSTSETSRAPSSEGSSSSSERRLRRSIARLDTQLVVLDERLDALGWRGAERRSYLTAEGDEDREHVVDVERADPRNRESHAHRVDARAPRWRMTPASRQSARER